MELFLLIMEGSIFICKKNHVFIEEDNPSSKVVTMEEALCDVKIEYVYMRPEVNSSRFEISNSFEMSSCLHGNLLGDFTAATFQTIARLTCIITHYYIITHVRMMSFN